MTDDEYRDLIEMGHQIEELTRHPGWPYFMDRAFDTVGKRQKQVLSGKLDPDEYRRVTGWLEGAGFVMSVPEAVKIEIAAEHDRRAEAE